MNEPRARLSIGALARATGIPVETLRTWERRYGFPVPERKPSGHRVYPVDAVPRLRRIAEVLSRGHRAAEVVGAGEEHLETLLQTCRPVAEAPRPPVDAAADLPEMLGRVRRMDAAGLTRALLGDWVRLDHLAFLEERVAPLIVAVGEGWAKGELDVAHEHFVSERVGDLLRSLRLPMEERASGAPVVLASLPGEAHALGLQMAALVLVRAGLHVMQLGPEVPLDDLAPLAQDVSARAVGLSVSLSSRGAATGRAIRKLRGLLPRRVALLVGGAGAPRKPPAGVTLVPDLRALDAWARAAADAR